LSTPTDGEPPLRPLVHSYLFPLPDPLPIPHGSTFAKITGPVEPALAGMSLKATATTPPWLTPPDGSTDRQNMVSLRFWQVKQPGSGDYNSEWGPVVKVADAISGEPEREWQPPPPMPTDGMCTVVEAVTFHDHTRDQTEYRLQDPLTRCIEVLLNYFRGYRISENVLVPELTYERLPFIVLGAVHSLPPDGPRRFGQMIWLDHANQMRLPPNKTLDSSGTARVIDISARLSAGDPMALFADRRLNARMLLAREGRYSESVVQTAIAAEVILDAVLGLAYWESIEAGRKTNDDAITAMARGLTVKINAEYGKLLGGTWTTQKGPMKRWSEDIAAQRNRVVHAGHRPERRVAESALEALQDLTTHIGDVLIQNWRKWPRLSIAFLGQEGFEKRGRTWAHPSDWQQRNGGEVAPWMLAYATWRKTVNPRIEEVRRTR